MTRLVTGVLIVAALAVAHTAEAQRGPRQCGVYVEIKSGKIVQPVKATRLNCEFAGQFVVLVNNQDNASYTVGLEKFRFDDTLSGAGACKGTNSAGSGPVGANPPQYFYAVGPYEVSASRPKKVKAKKYATECYKFDISLYLDGEAIFNVDPDLEVTDPPPPPPTTGPQKPPQ